MCKESEKWAGLKKYIGNRTTIQGIAWFQATKAQKHRHVSISITGQPRTSAFRKLAQDLCQYKESNYFFPLQKLILSPGRELAASFHVKKLFVFKTHISLVHNSYKKAFKLIL